MRVSLKNFCLPMMGVYFLLCLTSTLLGEYKDSLIAYGLPLDAVLVIRYYLVLPTSIGLTALLFLLSLKISPRKLFSIFSGGCALFLVIVGGWIVPHDPQVSRWTAEGATGLQQALGHWSLTLYYLLLNYSATLIPLFFWGVANTYCTLKQASRWYPLILLSTIPVSLVSLPLITSAATLGKPTFMPLVIGASLVAGLALFTWMDRQLESATEPEQVQTGRSPIRLTVWIGLLTFSAALAAQLLQPLWKMRVSHSYPSTIAYSNFMGSFSTAIGVATVFGAGLLILCSWLLPRAPSKGWKAASLTIPAIALAIGMAFLISQWTTASPQTSVQLGAAFTLFGRGIVGSLMLVLLNLPYLCLKNRYRFQAKVIVDGVFVALGKTAAAFISLTALTSALISYGTVAKSLPIFFPAFVITALLWIGSAWMVGNHMEPRPLTKQVG